MTLATGTDARNTAIALARSEFRNQWVRRTSTPKGSLARLLRVALVTVAIRNLRRCGGVVTRFYATDWPRQAGWLNERERVWITEPRIGKPELSS